jgi:uncharacterized membrane protein YozB (DUF420 family)
MICSTISVMACVCCSLFISGKKERERHRSLLLTHFSDANVWLKHHKKNKNIADAVPSPYLYEAMLRYVFYGLLVYLLIRFVFNFLIPMVKTTRQVRRQFEEVKNRMQDQMQDPFPGQRPQPQKSAEKVNKDDYLDFEEVKR